MQTLEKISQCMKDRPVELRELKSQGKKIVGYFPGGYFPDEMVYACGAVPVALNRGGDHEPLEIAGSYISRWIYTFGRACIGNRMSGTEPIYGLIDIFVVPVTDNHVRIVADTWDTFTDVEVFRFGVPHVKLESALEFYEDGLRLFKERLERLTGNEITDEKLRGQIELANRERELLSQLSEMRKAEHPPITGKEFIMLNHASLILDRSVIVPLLEEALAELNGKEGPTIDGPRLMIMSTTLAHGDYRVLDMVAQASGQVVIEESGEGIRHYQEKVAVNGDPVRALADRYFWKRVPPGWFRPGKERQENAMNLARDYKVDGVIWYQMLGRESDEMESYWYPDILKKNVGVQMLKLVSDYDSVERGQFITRIETFIESIKASKTIR